jgi:hypothetical protein
MNRQSISIAALGFLLVTSGASADGLFYLTGKLGTTGIDANVKASLDQLLDSNDASAALGVGARFGDHLAFELAYHDLGTVEGTASACPPDAFCLLPDVLIKGETTAVSLTFLPHLSVTDRLFAYGKLGVMSWDSSLSSIGPGLETTIGDFSDDDIVYGVGARFLFPGPIGVFAEYERFGDTFETVSIGGTFGF